MRGAKEKKNTTHTQKPVYLGLYFQVSSLCFSSLLNTTSSLLNTTLIFQLKMLLFTLFTVTPSLKAYLCTKC